MKKEHIKTNKKRKICTKNTTKITAKNCKEKRGIDSQIWAINNKKNPMKTKTRNVLSRRNRNNSFCTQRKDTYYILKPILCN